MNTSRYDVLFEPVKIGPVTAKNRFYQVPHCTGLGWVRPRMVADLRGMKAQGGWGVVCTEYCSIHPTSDDLPHPYASLWDDGDIKSHRLMTDQVHEHGALAGVELWAGGVRAANLFTNEVPRGVDCRPLVTGVPFHTRAMDRSDIKDLRRWHRDAALRARSAGFDIVYVYATHGYLLSNFLSANTNTRSDEYGGCLENRVRLVRELIDETKEAVGDSCAVAVRFSADAGGAGDGNLVLGEQQDMIAMLAELPDLWDINVSDYSLEMGVSRFVKEASLEAHMSYVKSVTTKPVVTVGRFTSPDTMLSQVKRGVVDFIGAARPSIADPYLPNKIAEGRFDDIRECIGCNICYTGDAKATPIRCTQNPTISEEWRRGWHPEKIAKKVSDSTVLVVGSGPAGLEAAHAVGKRGYHVLLAESRAELGGRVTLESRLPGLSEWARVRDYRVQQIQKMANVEVYLDSEMNAQDLVDTQAEHIVIATGATWRRDGVGVYGVNPVNNLSASVFTPDDIMANNLPAGPTLIFDDDHYYMASVIAERLRANDVPVVLATSASIVSPWGAMTSEQRRSQTRLLELGVQIITNHSLSSFDGDTAQLVCTYTSKVRFVEVQSIICVTSRQPNDTLYQDILKLNGESRQSSIRTINRIGDCDAPAIIAAAVFSGHRYARELENSEDDNQCKKFDRVFFDD